MKRLRFPAQIIRTDLYKTGSVMLVAVGLLFLSPHASAQVDEVPELVTDRPDQTESALVVPTGTLQVEVGGVIAVNRRDSLDPKSQVHFTFPGILLRGGIHRSIELRLGGGRVWQNYGNPTAATAPPEDYFTPVSGIDDILAGLKGQIFRTEEDGIDGAILAHAFLPFGTDGVTDRVFRTEVRASVAHDFDRYSLGYNVGAIWSNNDDPLDLFYTLAFGVGIDSRLTSFLEIYGSAPWQDVQSHAFDAGFAWLISDLVQLDLAAGFGLSEGADDAMLTTGISFRLPN